MRFPKKLLVRRLAFFLVPLIASPLLFFGKELKCVFVIVVMSIFWLLEVLPMGIVSLLPLFLFPFFEISKAKVICQSYFKDNIVLFMSSLIMAMSVEVTNLHRRIALSMLRFVGTNRHCILVGSMVTTAFVSFFVSDSAATILMLPIVLAILSTLEEIKENDTENETKKSSNSSSSSTSDSSHVESGEKSSSEAIYLSKMTKNDRAFCKAMVMATSQASLIGGTGLITGTGTNVVFQELISSHYPSLEVGYLEWMSFSVPWVPLYLLASWLVLVAVLMPGELVPNRWKKEKKEDKKETSKAMKRKIKEAYSNLGRISFAEGSVAFWFLVLLAAWCSRNPGFVNGWGSLFSQKNQVMDSTVAICVAILMFIWPRSLSDPKLEPILNWHHMKTKYSWSCTFLIAAGFAISEGVKSSGLGNLLACKMSYFFNGISQFWIQFAATMFVCFLTEFASNVATAGVFIPILLSVSKGLAIHPLYLVLPVTISCSFAFCFPIATPGNAVVYDTKLISMWDMISVGFCLNIICVLLTSLNFNTYAFWIMKLDQIPPSVATASLNLSCNNTSF